MPKSAHARVLAYAATFAAVQLALMMAGWGDAFEGFADDAFYGFQLARNAALGHGFTVDAVHATNGFHPLWLWLLVPVFKLFPSSPWIPLRIAVGGLILCSAGTAYALYRLGREVASERAGEIMAGVFLLSPLAWILPTRGMDSGLATLMLVLAAWQLARTDADRGAPLLGLLAGLAFLARTDDILWIVPAFALLAWRTRRARPVAVAAAVAFAVVLPWLAWNLARFGTVFQVSGVVKMNVNLPGRLQPAWTPTMAWQNLKDVLLWGPQFVMGEQFRLPRRASLLLCANVLLLGVALVASRRLRSPAPLVPLYVFAVAHTITYACILDSYSSWYVVPLVAVAAVFQGERLSAAPRALVAAYLVASAALCAWALPVYGRWLGRHPHGSEAWVRARLERIPELAPHARIGAWNSGRLGYFTGFLRPDVRVVNLDGLVNNDIVAAWRAGHYGEWLLGEVDWIAERTGALDGFMGVDAAAQFRRDHLVQMDADGELWRVTSRR